MQRIWLKGKQGWMFHIPMEIKRAIFIPDETYDKQKEKFEQFTDLIITRFKMRLEVMRDV